MFIDLSDFGVKTPCAAFETDAIVYILRHDEKVTVGLPGREISILMKDSDNKLILIEKAIELYNKLSGLRNPKKSDDNHV